MRSDETLKLNKLSLKQDAQPRNPNLLVYVIKKYDK